MLSTSGIRIFWLSIIVEIMLICILLGCCYMTYGTLNNKKEKLEVVFFTFVLVGSTLLFRTHLEKMDIPGIFSMRYEEMRGIIYDYKIKQGRESRNTVDVRDNRTRKITRFSYVDIPSDLHIGDSVRIYYLKHNKMGAIAEINGRKVKYYVYRSGVRPIGITLIILFLLSIPIYYFWVYKVKPVTEYKITYTAYAYHDLYIKAMKIVYFFMIQTAAVLIIAVKGDYKTSWDWYWGLLLIADYTGVFGLSFLRWKQFVIVKDKFYYSSFKKRVEGDLSEIESVEETDTGVIIRTKEAEMEVLCTSKHYREALINKLA